MLLSAEHLSKNYGMKQLLNNVSIYLNEKERIGIVGVNGTGKSTLLKILAGIEPADEGVISISSGIETVYLPQNPMLNDDFTALEQVFYDTKQMLSKENGYKEKAMLNRLGITDFSMKIGAMSVGQKKRVALAAALIRPCDILLLDEPTNHLDSQMVCWLEEFLSHFNGGLIMVTHDRYFLERVVNNITELEHSNLYTYQANFSKYLELKAERAQMNESSERKRQTLLKKEYQWIMRGAKARGTKSRERIERFEKLSDTKYETNEDPLQMTTISSRLGRKIIEMEDISKSFAGNKVIDKFSYVLLRDDRIGIVGKNGAGKSTLLNMITGKIPPDSGKVNIGGTVKIGYFMQECKELHFNQTVYDFICEIASEVKTREGVFTVTQMLERFLFVSDQQRMQIGRLSGGERRRLYLLSILMSAPNVLILDEPTNDLDIETLTILEDYLEYFPGAVIAVSHDRYFLDKMATSIFEVNDDGKISSYLGNYSDYAAKCEKATDLAKKSDKINTPQRDKSADKPKKLKFSFNEQHEFELIDDEIASLETKISDCSAQLINVTSDYIKLQEVIELKKNLEAQLEDKTQRWVYLNELFEKIEAQK
ncbi:MAG: ABC-F family ATP-binding cassette domain-containing protein [Oscillospiraceae bacterium]